MSKSGKLIICTDGEEFSASECGCRVCTEMNESTQSWGNQVPKTALQKRMTAAIAKIEEREKKRLKN